MCLIDYDNSYLNSKIFYTYTEYGVYEWVIAAVTGCHPVRYEEERSNKGAPKIEK